MVFGVSPPGFGISLGPYAALVQCAPSAGFSVVLLGFWKLEQGALWQLNLGVLF